MIPRASRDVAPEPRRGRGATRRVLTCDPGIDDAVAIAVAAGHPAIELAAVVAGAGNVAAPTAWRNAAGVATMAEIVVPVALGSDTALDGTPLGRGRSSHGADGLGGLAGALPPARTEPAADGAALVTGAVIATGPLTDVARAVRAGRRVDGVVWMGGSSDAVVSVDPIGAEFNASADPLALAEVRRAGVDVAVVPIEVTSQVGIGDEDVAPWRTGPPLARLCAALVDVRAAGTGSAVVHDAVAAVAAAEPGLFGWSPVRARAGETGALVPSAGGTPARVAVEVDVAAVRTAIVRSVLAAATAATAVPERSRRGTGGAP